MRATADSGKSRDAVPVLRFLAAAADSRRTADVPLPGEGDTQVSGVTGL
ncbi:MULTISPECIES: hypothetical protein [unclassified Streptomyces]